MSRYEFARSGRDRFLLLLFPEGSFHSLPFEVRLAEPWTGEGYGELAALKPADRVQYQQLGYVMVREVMQQGCAVQPVKAPKAAGRPPIRSSTPRKARTERTLIKDGERAPPERHPGRSAHRLSPYDVAPAIALWLRPGRLRGCERLDSLHPIR